MVIRQWIGASGIPWWEPPSDFIDALNREVSILLLLFIVPSAKYSVAATGDQTGSLRHIRSYRPIEIGTLKTEGHSVFVKRLEAAVDERLTLRLVLFPPSGNSFDDIRQSIPPKGLMSSAPVNPLEVPPYQVQSLISSVADAFGLPSTIQVRCAQALGSEIYIGGSQGQLIRFALQADNPHELQSYQILSHQTLPSNKPIEEIALIPSISRALVYSDRQIHFYTLPSLDPVPPTIIKPIRNVVTFAIDHQHLRRPPPSVTSSSASTEPVEFCVIKRSSIALYNILERLTYQKEIPLPHPVFLARRFGRALCVADQHTYSIVDLEDASIFPLLPICQTESAAQLRPSINVVSDNEFLITSFAEGGTLGVFITGDGIPMRGTLQWPSYPRSVCLDYPYVASLLPNDTIEIHNVDTQSIAQVIPAPTDSSPTLHPWLKLMSCSNGYLVPSAQRSDKMGLTSVRLLRA